MEGPSPGRVRAHQITHPLRRLDGDGVLVRRELSVPILQLTPQPMQMNRMVHHRVIDQNEAHPLPEFQFDGLGIRKTFLR